MYWTYIISMCRPSFWYKSLVFLLRAFFGQHHFGEHPEEDIWIGGPASKKLHAWGAWLWRGLQPWWWLGLHGCWIGNRRAGASFPDREREKGQEGSWSERGFKKKWQEKGTGGKKIESWLERKIAGAGFF